MKASITRWWNSEARFVRLLSAEDEEKVTATKGEVILTILGALALMLIASL